VSMLTKNYTRPSWDALNPQADPTRSGGSLLPCITRPNKPRPLPK